MRTYTQKTNNPRVISGGVSIPPFPHETPVGIQRVGTVEQDEELQRVTDFVQTQVALF